MRIVERPSPNHDARSGAVEILVLHYTDMLSAEEAVSLLCSPASKVSSHYTIGRDGTVYRHVPEERRAWHSGISHWAGAADVNTRSIGIELDNPGHRYGYVPFTDVQIESLIELAKGILSRHKILPARVVGHSDVAPARKIDPGELFPWPLLASRGIGVWPDRPAPEVGDWREGLTRFGYGLSPAVDIPEAKVIEAFQRHFRPKLINGQWDAECNRLLSSLLAVSS